MSTPKIDFQAFVKGLPDHFLACRADGHGPWRATGRTTWDNVAKYYDRHRACGSCGATKPQHLDIEGFILHTKGSGYRYPEGYLAKDVDLPESLGAQKAAYRLEKARREMSGGEPTTRRKRATAVKTTARAARAVAKEADSNVVPLKPAANGG